MLPSSVSDLTIACLAPLIRKRKLSPVELTRYCLERINEANPRLNVMITTTANLVMRQARLAEREIIGGVYRGPLHGMPMTLKDLFQTAGILTTAGSRILRRFRPSRNAVVVDRLREAGAVLLGKTNLHEFAFGATNVNPHYGAVRNPWDADRIAGGSSGGSAAAVAARLCVFSLGTDTGGSIRIPAAACGCVGFKPAFGALSTEGVIPLSPTLDHVGPICASVEDAVTVYEVLLGAKCRYRSRTRPPLRGVTVGVPRDYFFDRIQPEVRERVSIARGELARLGAKLLEVRLKGMDETADLAALITTAEALCYHSRWFDSREAEYGEDLRRRMRAARKITAVTYLQALERRREYARRFLVAFEKVDVLIAPTLPVLAPRIGDTQVFVGDGLEDTRLALLRFTRPANLVGIPSLSVPCGFAREDLPVGLQIMAPGGRESRLFRVAHAYECSG